MCRVDPLFYLNAMGWIFEPRPDDDALMVLPFITYPFQDLAFLAILNAIGKHDLVIEKSRDMGASWMCIYAFEWRWHFRRRQTFLMLSRNENLVDKTGSPDSLFYKLDFIHEHQPGWLLPEMDRMSMHMENNTLASVIDGESTNKFAGVAGRRLAILADEFSKMPEQAVIARGTQAVSNSRIFLFTPEGTGNMAYQMAEKPEIPKLTLHWAAHPVKSQGLYFTDEPGSGVRYDGKKARSPWYDREEERAPHKAHMAAEHDIDYLGSDSQFFDAAMLNRIGRDNCYLPRRRGHLIYDLDAKMARDFIEDASGPLSLWLVPTIENAIPFGQYVVGCDISGGGSMQRLDDKAQSNSVARVVDCLTREVVAELAIPAALPHEFAAYVVALCRWFHNAYLIWEANGPGIEFGATVQLIGYSHFYLRRSELSLKKTIVATPGFHIDVKTKSLVFSELRRAWMKGEFIERSRACLEEAKGYVITKELRIEYSPALAALDRFELKENHGDRVVSAAMAWWGVKELTGGGRVREPNDPPRQTPPENSMAGRYERWEKQQKKRSMKW